MDIETLAWIPSPLLDRAMRLQTLRAQVVALWPDWVSAPSIAAGELVDECTWVDAFGATWGLDSTVPYLIPDAGQYDAAPAAYDRRLACMVGEEN